jgi:hypothetical protein
MHWTSNLFDVEERIEDEEAIEDEEEAERLLAIEPPSQVPQVEPTPTLPADSVECRWCNRVCKKAKNGIGRHEKKCNSRPIGYIF